MKRIISLFILQYFGAALLCQTSSYNHAYASTTIISSETLDKEMLLQVVSSNQEWQGSFHENNWMKFEFEKEIFIHSIDLSFHQSTSLTNCKLLFKVILDDKTQVDTINSKQQRISINSKSKFLTLVRLDVYPRGSAFITSLKVNSTDQLDSNQIGAPKIDDTKRTHLRIIHELKGFDKKESIAENKLWRTRSKLFKRYFKNRLEEHEVVLMDETLSKQDDKYYCSYINSYITINDPNNLVRKVYEDCKCDMHNEYFNRGMVPSDKMMNEYILLRGDTIVYTSQNSLEKLTKLLTHGGAEAGWAVTHLCLMQKLDELDNIKKLRDDDNVFAQYQAMKACLYFNDLQAAKSIGDQILKREFHSLQEDSSSVIGIYAPWVLESLFYHYPDYSLDKFLELYKCYTTTALLKESFISWSPIYQENELNKLFNYRESHHGYVQFILDFIEQNLNKMPQLKDKPAAKEFKVLSGKRRLDILISKQEAQNSACY